MNTQRTHIVIRRQLAAQSDILIAYRAIMTSPQPHPIVPNVMRTSWCGSFGMRRIRNAMSANPTMVALFIRPCGGIWPLWPLCRLGRDFSLAFCAWDKMPPDMLLPRRNR